MCTDNRRGVVPEKLRCFHHRTRLLALPEALLHGSNFELVDAAAALALLSRNRDAFAWRDGFACQLIRLLAVVGSERLAVVGHAPDHARMVPMQTIDEQPSGRCRAYCNSDLRAIPVTVAGGAIGTRPTNSSAGTAATTSVLGPSPSGRGNRQYNYPSCFRNQS